MNSELFVISSKIVSIYCSASHLEGVLMSVPDLLQVLSILTMERPVSFAAEDIRDEKVCLLISLESKHTH